jgi:hypothetical protein
MSSNIRSLNADQISKGLALHTAIKTFRHYFPEEFGKTNIVPCIRCNGLGITDVHDMHPSSLCDECRGVGFMGYEHLEQGYVCKICNGVGCKNCNDKGYVDWVSNAMKMVVNR